MDSEKVQEFIKKIRKDYNLTQKELADKYGVTYQAVSKWENGKNLPDITLLVQIAKDYNIDLSDMLNIKQEEKNNKKIKYIIIGVIIVVLTVLCIIIIKNQTYEFKTIESSCKDFEVYGSLAYDSKKSSLYISNIKYCGEEEEQYKELSCSLFEKNNNTLKEIKKCDSKNNLTLNEYLKNINFNIENFSKRCDSYQKDDLYLEINATLSNNSIKTYKIPLEIDSNCKN